MFQAVTGVGSLAASVTFGLVWTAHGAATAFLLGATLGLLPSVVVWNSGIQARRS